MMTLSDQLKPIALIPARSGSKRIENKNIIELNGHPLLAYSIRAAINSGCFTQVLCVTDSVEYKKIAEKYGASVPELRPDNISGDKSPDIEWINWVFGVLENRGETFDSLAILRPTNPFRSSRTIIKAFDAFISNQPSHSLRAVSKVTEHPGKMWKLTGRYMTPILPYDNAQVPWHSSQMANLPPVYIQNASLEIVWKDVVSRTNTISGEVITPYISDGYEGFDINNPLDLIIANNLISEGVAHVEAI